MQLGTRWPAGAIPPSKLSAEWLAAIAVAEAEGCDTGFWTLTWLEGRPRVAHDSGLQLVVGEEHNDLSYDEDEW